VRSKEQLPLEVTVMSGEIPDLASLRINGLTMQANLMHGQKTGIYLDQRENYRAAARYFRRESGSLPGGNVTRRWTTSGAAAATLPKTATPWPRASPAYTIEGRKTRASRPAASRREGEASEPAGTSAVSSPDARAADESGDPRRARSLMSWPRAARPERRSAVWRCPPRIPGPRSSASSLTAEEDNALLMSAPCPRRSRS